MTDFDLLLIISIALSSLLLVFIGGNMYRLNKAENELKATNEMLDSMHKAFKEMGAKQMYLDLQKLNIDTTTEVNGKDLAEAMYLNLTAEWKERLLRKDKNE